MSDAPSKGLERRFVDYLISLHQHEERGALAQLRRAVNRTPAEARDAWRYVIPRVVDERRRDDYFLVAGLFATHPCSSGASLGSVFRRLDPGHEHESTEKRFAALLASRRADLSHHLATVIRLARSNDIPVDYERLFRDLKHWEHPGRFVQYRWAQEFWGRAEDADVPNQGGE